MKKGENKIEENLIETKGFKPGEKVFSVDQMSIAVMPKKFATTSLVGGNTKKIGIIILSLGAFFLIVIFVSAYWYFFQYNAGKNKQVGLISGEEINLDILDDNLEVLNEKPEKKKNDLNNFSDNLDQNDEGDDEDVQKLLEKNLEAQEKKKNQKKENEEEPQKVASSTKKIIIKNIATTTPKEEIKSYQKVPDSDQDGLSDAEEGLLDCSVNSSDSDQDGYDDLSEFLNLYNPAGAGVLMLNSGIEEYRNGKYNYKVYYPKIWKPMETGEGESLIFNIGSNNFIQIIAIKNEEKLSLEDWFKKQFDVNIINTDQNVYKRGWLAYKSKDGLNIYLNRPGKNEIYTLSYSVPSGEILAYQNIFQMMLNSFELIK